MKNSITFEQKIYRERARHKRWRRNHNFNRNNEKKSEIRERKRSQRKTQLINIPIQFSLITNRDKVLAFFDALKKIKRYNGLFLFLDFSKVREISHGAVTILLSYIGWLNDQGFAAGGNYPEDKASKEI